MPLLEVFNLSSTARSTIPLAGVRLEGSLPSECYGTAGLTGLSCSASLRPIAVSKRGLEASSVTGQHGKDFLIYTST
jgi:hypothetical protein